MAVSDVWLVGHDGKAAVWVRVDGVWRVAIREQQVADASVSYCVNLEGARPVELPEVRLTGSLLDERRPRP